jgi:hypothetical protein
MKKILLLGTAAAGIVAAMALSSCAYDPAYTSISGTYGSGYGYGYGYGGSGFNTSIFVSTGDSRWGYDPYSYCYYDYRTRRYYDPYLYGYYPIGYRPPILIGVPHPYGYRPGRGYCPPPRVVKNVTVVNYRNRESAYRTINHDWARNVRRYDYSRYQSTPHHAEMRHGHTDNFRRTDYGPRPTDNRGWLNPRDRDADWRLSPRQAPQGRERPEARPPSSYNTPVTREAIRPMENSAFDRRNRRENREFNRTERRAPMEVAPTDPRSARSREMRTDNPRFQRSLPEAVEAAPSGSNRRVDLRNRGQGRQFSQPQGAPQAAPQPDPTPQPPQSNGGEPRPGRRTMRSLGEG